MVRFALAAALASGCVAHGGATVGIRASGKPTIGWHAGAGSFGSLVVGQSYSSEGAFTYGGIHGWYPLLFESDDDGHREAHVGLLVGGGAGPRGRGFVAGADARYFVGDYVGEGDQYAGACATLGVRLLGEELEVFAALQAMWLNYGGGD